MACSELSDLHHDNAAVHTCKLTTAEIQNSDEEVIDVNRFFYTQPDFLPQLIRKLGKTLGKVH